MPMFSASASASVSIFLIATEAPRPTRPNLALHERAVPDARQTLGPVADDAVETSAPPGGEDERSHTPSDAPYVASGLSPTWAGPLMPLRAISCTTCPR